MSRDLSVGLQNQINATYLSPFFACELYFSQTVRYWTGYGEISFVNFDGNTVTFYGTGELLEYSAIQETADIAATGMQLKLNGVSSDAISLALNEDYQGNKARIYFGVCTNTATGRTINGTPYKVFEGKMDVIEINDTGETSTLTLNIENRLIDLERQRLRRYTSEDQYELYGADKGFDFVPKLQDDKISWGT
jgi:hypothetical protein